MSKKYKLTEKYIERFGAKLYQIQALVAFGTVAAGELGGYIQSESCLSHSGNSWVSDNARVSGNARVSDDARVSGNAQVADNALVYGNARVSGDAQVYGNVWVYGDAQVHGDAWVYGNARVYGRDAIFWASRVGSVNGTLTVTSGKNGLVVTRGCFCGSTEEFLAKSAQEHSEKIQREYKLLIEVAESRIEHHKAPECGAAPT